MEFITIIVYLSIDFYGDIVLNLGMKIRDKIKVSEMKKRVVGYIRTSTKLQSNSVEMQKHKIKDYCEMNNLILDELILDEG